MALVKDALAANLKKYRKQSGMTIDEVGVLIGKSGKTVSAWENGRGQPDADMLIKLCAVYDVRSVADLLDGRAVERLNEKPAISDELANDEYTLLQLFRRLNDDGRDRLLEIADDMVQSGKYTKSDSACMDQKEA